MHEFVPGVFMEKLSDKVESEIELSKINRLGNSRNKFADTLLEEMRGHIDFLEKAMTPARITDVENWLIPIAAQSKHSYPEKDVQIRLNLCASALSDFPHVVFNDVTMRIVMRSSVFFPTAAEITDLIYPYVSKLKNLRWELERLYKTSDPEAYRVVSDPRVVHLAPPSRQA